MAYAQIVGLLAVIVWLVSIRKKNKKEIMKYQIIANILYAIQYLFLNAMSAVGMSLFAVARTSVFYKYETTKKLLPKSIFIMFVIITLILGTLTYTDIMSIIPTINSMLYVFSLYQKKLSNLYIFVLFAAVLWLIYNTYVGAYATVIGNIFEIVFAIISIKDSKHKKNKKSI